MLENFVEATYKLESNGPVALKHYKVISSLSLSVKMENYPNLQAIVKSSACGKNRCTIKMEEICQRMDKDCYGLF